MTIYRQQSLLGDTELLLDHAALPMPVHAVAPCLNTAEAELQRLVILHIKEIVAKYLSVVRKSRGNYLSTELQSVLEQAYELKRKIRRNSRLPKVQQTLIELVPLLERLMSRPQSRFYRSQTSKIDFLNQVAQLEVGSAKTTKNVHL